MFLSNYFLLFVEDLTSKENVKNIQEFTQVIKPYNYSTFYYALQPTQSKENEKKKYLFKHYTFTEKNIFNN